MKFYCSIRFKIIFDQHPEHLKRCGDARCIIICARSPACISSVDRILVSTDDYSFSSFGSF